ncbi:hypothetical protein EDB83DRAFT_2364537 [Lactarius deliciosus]|nr:hypothetical protein EDB83DRAFT_2364537 [Lactarius deliciosus]
MQKKRFLFSVASIVIVKFKPGSCADRRHKFSYGCDWASKGYRVDGVTHIEHSLGTMDYLMRIHFVGISNQPTEIRCRSGWTGEK